MIDTLILPSHCTHVLQMFDVSLAAPMKRKFNEIFAKTLCRTDIDFSSNISKVRYAAVHAVITGWEAACTTENCRSAAEATGMRPCTDEPLRNNPFVRDLNEQELEVFRRHEQYAQRHFLCSGKLLTDPEVFQKLCEHVRKRDDLSLVSSYSCSKSTTSCNLC